MIYIYIFHQNGWLNDLGSETIEEHTHFFLNNMWRWEGLNVVPHRMSTGGVVRMHNIYTYIFNIYIHIYIYTCMYIYIHMYNIYTYTIYIYIYNLCT